MIEKWRELQRTRRDTITQGLQSAKAATDAMMEKFGKGAFF